MSNVYPDIVNRFSELLDGELDRDLIQKTVHDIYDLGVRDGQIDQHFDGAKHSPTCDCSRCLEDTRAPARAPRHEFIPRFVIRNRGGAQMVIVFESGTPIALQQDVVKKVSERFLNTESKITTKLFPLIETFVRAYLQLLADEGRGRLQRNTQGSWVLHEPEITP